MPTKPQIAQEAARKLAEKIAQTLFAPNHSDKFPAMRRAIEEIEAELHRALDDLLIAAKVATEICDEDDNCKACRLRKELERW